MNLQEIIKARSINWDQLDKLCNLVEKNPRNLKKEDIFRFSSLYRSACADLALAESYHFPSTVVARLKSLVVRAHSALYSKKPSRFRQLFAEMPRAIATDPYVHFCFIVFWVVFVSVCLLIKFDIVPGLAESIVGENQLQQYEQMHSGQGNAQGNQPQASTGGLASAVGYYVFNNAGIGLMCFSLSVLVIPGITVLVSNAAILGATFGFLMNPERSGATESFQTFVLAHGPFELTAIVLSAGAGLRLGMSLVDTGGLDRKSSFLYGAQKALPVVLAAVLFFFIAAVIEGLISNYHWSKGFELSERIFKGGLGMISSWGLIFYFVGLGIVKPLRDQDATIESLGEREWGQQSWI